MVFFTQDLSLAIIFNSFFCLKYKIYKNYSKKTFTVSCYVASMVN